MATRRHGSLTAFWNAQSISASAVSSVVEVGRNVENMSIFLLANGAATAKVQVGHSGVVAPDGTSPDAGPAGSASVAAAPYDSWFDLYYVGSAASNLQQIVLAGAGAGALSIPDFGPSWIRLVLTAGAAVTVTAGYEASGD